MSSTAASSEGSSHHIIGLQSSRSRSKSDDPNQCNMQKKDSNFLLYENCSIKSVIRSPN
jgi:hypothetical protein